MTVDELKALVTAACRALGDDSSVVVRCQQPQQPWTNDWFASIVVADSYNHEFTSSAYGATESDAVAGLHRRILSNLDIDVTSDGPRVASLVARLARRVAALTALRGAQ